MGKLAALDYISMGIYLALMAGVGSFFGWFIKDIKGYFSGGNTIPWGISAVSNFMGSLSTFVFIAYAGIAYTDGLVGVTVLWGATLPFLFAALVIGKKWVRSRILTPVEYLETRFNNNIRQLFSWTGLGMRFLDNMVRQYAMGIFLTAATDLDFVTAIVLSGAVTTLFTIVGGVWAVVVMDTLQFIILVFVSVLLVPLSLNAAGGLGTLMTKLPEHFHWFNGPKGQPTWLLVYYLMLLLKYNGNWVFIQRFYSVKDEAATRKLGFLSAALLFVFPIIFLLPAIAAADILPGLEDPEQAYVALAVQLLPAGLLGLMIAAMFSATMSSLNSEFNVMSAVLTNDIYKRLINPDATEKQLILVARLNIVLVGIIVVGGSLFIGRLGSAFEANKLLTGLFAIPLAIPLVLGLLFRKTNAIGAFFTVLTGFVAGLVFNLNGSLSWEMATLLQIIACTVVFFLSGYLLASPEAYRERVAAFFAKIDRPLSAAEIGESDPAFTFALSNLFSIAIFASGVLFSAMSLPSVNLLSGRIALLIGLVCILLSAAVKWGFTGTFRFKN
ncbi:sodium/solute symporter [Neolewinella lacunae]|uniref:Sodium/solute symporter n=1 Tax=Neolewinella lacunae TaxID=1517758 RepID=A0A923PKQ0_9BACT|nr:sodium/solute symporter [Neolewinella lacunae]MBC6995144.1 sodium/solute symporter [Neolewinella lacunae]MDN3634094.1 sodium/solute symporter [Neolewinella lacunae]